MKNVTFLQLTPEFGGTKFGPFDSAEIRLGSDPGSNDITLPETLGVAHQHVKILRQQDNSFIIAPVDRTAPIFFFRSGTARPKQVTSPLAVQGGDAFALVTPEGPRFVLIVESDPRAIKAASEDASGPGLGEWGKRVTPTAGRLGRGLAEEIKRRGFAAVLTTRLGNSFMRVWTMVKSGAIFSPVYIVSGMMMFSGWMFAGGTACAVFRLNTSKRDTTQQLSRCQDELGVVRNAGDNNSTDPSVPDLTQTLLGDPQWQSTIQSDTALRNAFTLSLREVYSDANRYRWVYNNRNSTYQQFSKALERAGLSPGLVRVLSFAAATPSGERQWAIVNDSEGAEVCGRGILGLTYRQAINLGMSVQPDALADPQLADSNDTAKQREALDKTIREAGVTDVEYRDDLIESGGAQMQGGMTCIYVDDADERTDIGAIAQAIGRKIGASAKKVPGVDEPHWIAARLLMLYAQDFKAYQLESLDLDASTAPTILMSSQDIKDTRKDFAIREAGRVMGRAAAIPCIARFDKKTGVPEWFMKPEPPLGTCAILKAYVELELIE